MKSHLSNLPFLYKIIMSTCFLNVFTVFIIKKAVKKKKTLGGNLRNVDVEECVPVYV